MFAACSQQSQDADNEMLVGGSIELSSMPQMPPNSGESMQHGLAAFFAGMHNGAIIVAGGCNFPNKPAAENGSKKYYSDIFVLTNDGDNYEWTIKGTLAQPLAYGASVSLPEGVLCIGGVNGDKEVSNVVLLAWDNANKTIKQTAFPELPFTMSQHGAVIIDNTVYVAAGKTNGITKNTFLKLDLSKKGRSDFAWELMPDFPGNGRLQAVIVAQNQAEEKHLYILSGSSFPDSVKLPLINTDGLEYNPISNKWTEIGKINVNHQEFSLHGGAGINIGANFILCLGGVNKQIFSNALLEIRKAKIAKQKGDTAVYNKFKIWKQAYLSQKVSDYKFNKAILLYNTITKQWSIVDTTNITARAGASLLRWNDKLLLINGELKPGIRSPNVDLIDVTVKPQFGIINWLILIIYLLSMVYLGYYFMKKDQNTDDFFKGGGNIPWWAAGISIFATMLSAITFMAIPAKVYATNWKYFPMAVTILIMAFPVVKYYLPFFVKLKLTSAYEYLEIRFNYTTRALAGFIFIIFMVARMALVLFLPSLALSTVTGINIYISIILMGVVTIIYCTMGGIEAVVWGDVVQGIVLMGGAIIALIFLISGTEGGFSAVIDISVSNNKFQIFDWAFDWKRATIWVVVLGGLANNLISYSSDQTVIQRYMTTKDENASRRSIILNGFLSIAVSVLFYFIGTALFAYYTSHPERMNFTMNNPDAIFPQFIMAELPVGLAGLLIAAIFAATMSTISSNINSIATAFTSDFYVKWFKNSSEKQKLKTARYSGIIFGSIGVGLALLMATWNILSLFDYFNYILGLMSSGLGGLFAIGIFFPRIDGKSALIGFVLSTILLLIISVYTDVSFLLFGFIGIVLSIVIALLSTTLRDIKN